MCVVVIPAKRTVAGKEIQVNSFSCIQIIVKRVVVAIDTKWIDNDWFVFVNGGKVRTELKTIEWARKAEQLGAGEILLTSMGKDGTKEGFALKICQLVSESVNIPVIASGGAGEKSHFKQHANGLEFPGDTKPDYFDFAYLIFLNHIVFQLLSCNHCNDS